MRVTTSMMHRNFTSSVNSVHSNLNRSLNKISSGEEYESAAENPLAYYEGKRIDNQYQDTLSKISLIKDVQNRIYQQELGARDIHSILGKAQNQVQYARTATTTGTALGTLRDDLMQKQHEIVNDLNAQYENFYIYGGNDISTPPFSLSADGATLTYSHKFPGETKTTEITMKLELDANDQTYKFNFTSLVEIDATGGRTNIQDNGDINKKGEELLTKAMSEKGYMDLGYGSVRDWSTLLDTYTGGFNVLTGLNSDTIIANSSTGRFQGKDDDGNPKGLLDYMNESPLALIGRSIQAIDKYQKDKDADFFDDIMAETIDDMTVTQHSLSTVFSDLGNKYNLLDETDDKLKELKLNLETEYKNKLGADPYEAIMDMYRNQYSYNAALQVGSQLMSSSLFDFIR